jgi:hypothetical protein
MIASFFQRLDEHAVDWLLVSGQASILYGAATFSEDIDLWVEPSDANVKRCKEALRAVGARYYKLTPPFTGEFADRHHGFHFLLPDTPQVPATFLDIMGRPPRVEPFPNALGRARTFDTEWGALRTISIVDLVELKKTQRPRDYPVISRLALLLLEEAGTACTEAQLRWALDNVFTLAEFERLIRAFPETARLVSKGSAAEAAAKTLAGGGELEPDVEDALEDWFDERMAPLRRADRKFWRPVIEELRNLRATGQLAPEGELV